MANEAGWKLLQKQAYDLLSHRYGSLALAAFTVLLIVSVLQFGEQWLEWSQDKYAALFNSFNDNISGRSFQRRLCLPVPIDVVYTWVNGTDPSLIRQLRNYKMQLETEVNETSDGECTFTHCVPSNMAVLLPPPEQLNEFHVDLETLGMAHPIYYEAKQLKLLKITGENGVNVSVVLFDDDKKAKTAAHQKISLNNRNITTLQGYLSSDWTIPNSILLKDTILMTGFPHELTSDQLKLKLPERYQKAVERIDLFAEKGFAILIVSNKEEFDYILQEHNVTIDGKQPTFNAANLVWDLTWNRKDDDIGANRFEDNEELRYSLRSVETHAPWVRHIYVVTNGQIPSWLNLDNPRLTIVTHQELFPNKSHLPTFSSPAIESHLHRIPGLSDKFIYLNDDVMFGRDVWPDDFYTHSNGQKVYLTWPVPNCQEGCPSSWIKDGYCDKACNNSECEWDGGDCAGGGRQPYQFDAGPNQGGWGMGSDELYCNSGCANNWIADRYCDQACNVKPCGFDAGDCGVKAFHRLHGINLDKQVTQYSLPKGETVAWLNLTGVFGANCSIDEGHYDENDAIRSATIAQKFKTMTLIVYDKYNATTLYFRLKGKFGQNDTVMFNFTVTIDPKPVKMNTTNQTALAVKHEIDVNGTLKVITNATKEKFTFEDIPVHLQSPKSIIDKRDVAPISGINISEYQLPEQMDRQFNTLLQQFLDGELTEKGFNLRQAILWNEYKVYLQAEGKELVKKPPTTPQYEQKDPEEIEGAAGNAQDNQPVKELAPTPKYRQRDGLEHQELIEGAAGNAQYPEQPKVPNQNLGEPQKRFHKTAEQHQNKLQNGLDEPIEKTKEQKQGMIEPEERNDQQNYQLQDRGHQQTGQHPLQEQQWQQPGQQANEQVFVQQQNVQVNNQQWQQPIQKWDQHQAEDKKFDDYLTNKIKDKKVEDNIIPENINADQKLIVDGQQVKLEKGNILEQSKKSVLDQQRNVEPAAGNVAVPDIPGQILAADQQPQNDVPLDKQKDVYAQDNSFKSRKLNTIKIADGSSIDENIDGFLPWEKKRVFDDLVKKREAIERQRDFETVVHKGRKLLDTFGDSLRHVNKLFNNMYGYNARKVPAHMPHLIDKNIMYELQEKFPKEWDVTSSHKIRSSDDMQFAFSYMYYVMSEPEPTTVQQVFAEYDNDHSGILSDREIRTMATRLYDLPLDLQTLTGLEKMFINCSKHLPPERLTMPLFSLGETYYDKEMPQITEYLIVHCEPVIDLMRRNVKQKNKYKHEVLGDEEVAFKMIHTNVSHVVGQLDDIRKHPKKFICLNDNIEHGKEEAKTVKAVLADFYESLFPIPSSFELPREYRNRFLTVDELKEWRKYRDWLKMWTHLALFLLITFTIASFFSDKLEALQRKILGRRALYQATADTDGTQAGGEAAHKPIVTV